MSRRSNYDKFPFVASGTSGECAVGWDAIAPLLADASVVCVECYPGVDTIEVAAELARRLQPTTLFLAADAYKSADDIQAMVAPHLGADRVFGRMNGLTLDNWFDAEASDRMRANITAAATHGAVLVVGSGAALLTPQRDVLVYADMARWEIQLRYRRFEAGNLGCDNNEASFAEKYKCGFFVEWRAADRLKKTLLPSLHFLLDTNDALHPKMISGDVFRNALDKAARRPFRVVPYFDPGPWGGHWMERVCDLPKGAPNYAWCFDCVPEENSLLLGFGDTRVEIPSIDVVFHHPRELLGDAVHARFGTEFPIRFDFLDTMGGGNLSLQVHPLTEYIQEKFGMNYTQDESYYLLDAEPGAVVYLGLKNHIDRAAMASDLRAAQNEGGDFPADRYVNQFPAKPHDHFLIPAGTIHCSGAGSMVARNQRDAVHRFTFKLLGLGPSRLRPRRPATAHPHRPWPGQYSVGPHSRVVPRQPGQCFPDHCFGRGLAGRIHRSALARVHRDPPPLVHRPGTAPHPWWSQRTEPRGRRRGHRREPYRGIRAVRRPLCRNVHRASQPSVRIPSAPTAWLSEASAPR